MAYDSKKLKTLKWLEKLCSEKRRYNKFGNSVRLMEIFARFGRLYATDSIICACVEYPENVRAGEFDWQILSEFTDEKGYLLPILTFEDMEKPFTANDFFEKYFPAPRDYAKWDDTAPVNPDVLMFALKPFKINGINPYFAFTPNKIVLSGHNRDVSMKVCMMCTSK